MTRRIPLIALVGRTNVGKSTIFNAIVGRRLAIVEDSPGVTRDRSYAVVERQGFTFKLTDTGGLMGTEGEELGPLVRKQTEAAIQESDLVVAVFDALEGLNPLDQEVVNLLRTSGKPVIWVANKCEKPSVEASSNEFYTLGIDSLFTISAAHNQKVRELVDLMRETFEKVEYQGVKHEGGEEAKIKVALLGRPNVGKSTLLNRIVGSDRVVTSPVPGTTRDSIDVEITRDGQKFVFVDTAGLRKKARIDEGSIERFSNLRSLRAMAQCDVAVLVIDATQGIPSEQDTKIAGLINERGKGLIIVVNKWDAVEKDHKTVKAFTDAVYEQLKFARYAPILFVSGLTGRRCPSILETVKQVFDSARYRIKTSDLNRALEKAFATKPPPARRGEAIKLNFSTQVDVAPPTFILFVNHPEYISFGYERYVKNVIRDTYPFPGVDIKVQFRKKRQHKEELERAE